MDIKEARTKANLTQREMSDIFEIPIRTISNWESGSRACTDYVEKLIVEKLEGIKMKAEWLSKLMESLKVGDLVSENNGSFKKSMTYVVTEITEEKIICRLLKNEYSEKMLKMNHDYCSKDKTFEINKLGSFPAIIKLNDGYKDTDEERKENIQNIW
ncbi:MAG: helix-turn-helix transcriptional regulator [Lachnospiraceae bacterium]